MHVPVAKEHEYMMLTQTPVPEYPSLQAAELAANLAEIEATINSPLLTEDPNMAASAMSAYRVRKDHYKVRLRLVASPLCIPTHSAARHPLKSTKLQTFCPCYGQKIGAHDRVCTSCVSADSLTSCLACSPCRPAQARHVHECALCCRHML